jgi:heme o synthase
VTTVAIEESKAPAAWRDWLELTKPRIAGFVLFAAFAAALLHPSGDVVTALVAAIGVGAVAAGSSALNHVVERRTDSLMERTRSRPLPSGRLATRSATTFAFALGAMGTALLGFTFGLVTAAFALATFGLYAGVYVTLKRRTALNTVVGALPGAMPPLLAYGAVAERATGAFSGDVWGWALFLAVFAWQFPHFMAIAYLYREDYRRGGHEMLPAIPGAEALAGRQSLVWALVLVPATLLPLPFGAAGFVYAAAALVLGGVFAVAAGRFAIRQDDARARRLLRVSLIHLPALIAAALVDRALLG